EIRWITAHTTKKAFGQAIDAKAKYGDHLLLYKKFYVDPSWATREHRVSVHVHMAPKLIGKKLKFHWAGHTIDVQKYKIDAVHGRIKREVGELVGKLDFQKLMDDGVRDAAGKAYCKAVPVLCH